MENDDPRELLFENRQFGTDKEGKWTPETDSYRRNPTIENYIRIRRANPNAEVNVFVHGGLEQLEANETELNKYGIDPDIFVRVFDADPTTISYLSLFFLERIIEKRRLEETGETQLVARGLAVPDKLIDWFVTCALDAMSRYGQLEIERDLIVLIRERLGGSFVEYEARTIVHEKRQWAAWCAGAMIARGESPSFRKVAARMRVSQTTVMRWFDGLDFRAEAEKWSHLFDADGNLRRLLNRASVDLEQQPLRANGDAQRDQD